jgi:hypothetical protein
MKSSKHITMRLFAVAMLVLSLGSMTGTGTRANFIDTGNSTGNTFNAGTVDLTLAGSDNVAGTINFTSDMVPGDATTGPVGGLEVLNNDATGKAAALRYGTGSWCTRATWRTRRRRS